MQVPLWTLNSFQLKINHKHNTGDPHTATNDLPSTTNNTDFNNKNIYIVVPHIRGMQVHFQGHNTIWTLLNIPKDKHNMCQKSGAIYHYKCSHTDCPEQYIEESGQAFGERFREHLRAPPPIHLHSQTTGHQMDLECFTIINREAQGATRTTKEAMYICKNDPSLNRNLDTYNLPHLWDELL